MATRPRVRGTTVLLDHVARLARTAGESALAGLGLRPRHLRTLTVLRDGGELTQRALAATLSMDRTNLVGLLNELEADGLVERRRSAADRRRHMVAITDAGAERLAEAERVLTGVEDEVLSALDATERDTLYALLARVSADRQAVCGGEEPACTEDPAPGC
jgi:DNA-binding MarR family transcriptional regulator